jgi:predicted DNA-binding transcriptional regulator AlpA
MSIAPIAVIEQPSALLVHTSAAPRSIGVPASSYRPEQQNGLIVRTSKSPGFIGVPASTFYELAKRPDFPRKIIFGRRTTGYLESDLRAWVARQGGQR